MAATAGSLIYEKSFSTPEVGVYPGELPGTPDPTPYQTAIFTFALPSLLLQGGQDYTISFYGNDFVLPIFRSDSGPVYQDDGPLFPPSVRHEVVLTLPNNTQVTDVSLGFELDGAAAPPPGVPEPSAWSLMLCGLGAVGGLLRRRRATPAQVLALQA
ncbi:MAG: PEP-CTERM sorting domain-containing protein [Phenylobacterium sp.]|nr:MAG: PEP-CTERM sorting domain-containing protein [Phenylobacterium sp.]